MEIKRRLQALQVMYLMLLSSFFSSFATHFLHLTLQGRGIHQAMLFPSLKTCQFF
jgi:hypothetical protein